MSAYALAIKSDSSTIPTWGRNILFMVPPEGFAPPRSHDRIILSDLCLLFHQGGITIIVPYIYNTLPQVSTCKYHITNHQAPTHMITPEQRSQIEQDLHKDCDIKGTYEIDDQGRVSVAGNVIKRHENITKLHVKFDVVTGHMQMDRCKLRSLTGFPRRVGGNVSIARTHVSSLEGGPELVGGHFWAYGCLLKNLVGAPTQVLGKFVVHENDLNSYLHVPQSCTMVELPYNPTLPVLRLLQYPDIRITGQMSWENIRKADQLTQILSKYAGEGKKAMLNCALELKKHGYAGNARW